MLWTLLAMGLPAQSTRDCMKSLQELQDSRRAYINWDWIRDKKHGYRDRDEEMFMRCIDKLDRGE